MVTNISTYKNKARVLQDDFGIIIRLVDGDIVINLESDFVSIHKFGDVFIYPLSGVRLQYFCDSCQKVVKVEFNHMNANVESKVIVSDDGLSFVNHVITDADTRYICSECGEGIDDLDDLDDDEVIDISKEKTDGE